MTPADAPRPTPRAGCASCGGTEFTAPGASPLDSGYCLRCGTTRPVPPASVPACATVPNDSTCPCGTALVRNGEVVHSHWTGSICAECEQAIIEKYNARMREAHRD